MRAWEDRSRGRRRQLIAERAWTGVVISGSWVGELVGASHVVEHFGEVGELAAGGNGGRRMVG